MNQREADFAGRHGYTMSQLQDRVYSLLLTHKCPVWSFSQIHTHLFRDDTRAASYRHVIKACNTLKESRLVHVDNWFDCNNVTVVWADARMLPPIKPEIPF